ncbi:hypothetical protein HRbin30_00810 [bacterium HR30]|nr:hypothetical protein HRbin30_00810 [bacterium HR30]
MKSLGQTIPVWLFVYALATAPSAAAAVCVGDCNGDREVTIDELVTMVNIALGTQPVAGCLAGDANNDGEVTIEEIVTGVNHALSGCPPSEACTEAIATIALSFDLNQVPNLAGLTLDLTYPAQLVSLPAAEQLAERLLDVSDAGGFFDAQVVSGNGSAEPTLRVSYLTPGQIQPGPLLEVTFDCISTTPPAETQFPCVVRQASDGGGFNVQGVTCQVVLDVE